MGSSVCNVILSGFRVERLDSFQQTFQRNATGWEFYELSYSLFCDEMEILRPVNSLKIVHF